MTGKEETGPEDSRSSSEPQSRRPWFDPLSAGLMAVSTLASAWCSYQSSQWSGQSGHHASEASRLQRHGTALHLEINQVKTVDISVFLQVINARFSGNEKLMRFYLDRSTPELKAAYAAWLAQNPFENPEAPPHPFGPAFYKAPLAEEAARTLADEINENHLSRVAGTIAGTYLSNTVLLATVLFFAGTARNFDRRHVRLATLSFGIAVFAFCLFRALRLPFA